MAEPIPMREIDTWPEQQLIGRQTLRADALRGLRRGGPRGRLASADARATQAEARAAAETAIRAASEITAIIDDGLRAGRIPPAARPQLEAFAATATPKALRAFVASFPALTRPNAQGGSPTQDVAPQMSEEAQAAFHKMCRNPAARDIAETARGSFQITGDGEIVTGSKSFALKALQGDK